METRSANNEEALRSLLDLGVSPSFRGKVREMLDLGNELVMVATDRISAFDCILPTLIPGKGKILSSISAFWLRGASGIMRTHFISDDPERLPETLRETGRSLQGRWMLVRKAKPLPVECIVRGYLVGSGWREYENTGTIGGQPLPPGLQQFGRIDPPLFTPSTKSHEGHDENISPDRLADVVGREVAASLERLSVELYRRGAAFALGQGLILADTKFEFGWLDDEICLIDEIFTPDSSRYWPSESLEGGGTPKSLDKEYVRQLLKSIPWNGDPPAPELSPEVVRETLDRYGEVGRRLMAAGGPPDLGRPLET